jgi:hypothetical protein
MARSGSRRTKVTAARTGDNTPTLEWSAAAARLYAASFCDEWVADRLRRDGYDVPREAVVQELRRRPGVRRRNHPAVVPFSYDGLSSVLTDERRARIDAECATRLIEEDSDNDVYDWKLDQLARFSPVEHLCFNNDPLFNSEEMVEAMIRRLKKYQVAVGRPVAGEAFEDILANAWRDVGHNVYMPPRNHDGPDVHIALQNQWVAVSMKSEAREQPRRDLQITSLSPHHQDLRRPGDCVSAVRDALDHLSRYRRMIYLRVTGEAFPNDAGDRLALHTSRASEKRHRALARPSHGSGLR